MRSRSNRQRSVTRRFVDHEEGFSAGTPATTAPHLLTIMWRRKLIIVASVLLALIAGWATFKKMTPSYSSNTKLLLKVTTPQITLGNQIAAAAATPQFSVNTEFEIVRSTAVLERALRRPDMQSALVLQSTEKPVAYLQDLIQMTAGKTEDIMLISASCPTPDDASTIVNGVAEAYKAYTGEQQESNSKSQLDSLKAEKEKREKEREEVVSSLNDLKRKNNILYLEGNRGNVQQVELSDTKMRLLNAEEVTRDARVRFERMDELKDQAAALKAFMTNELAEMGVQINGFAGRAEGMRQEAAARLEELESRLGARHPEVERMHRVVDAPITTDSNAQFAEAFRALVTQKLATAMKRENELDTLYKTQAQQVLQTNLKEQEIQQLQEKANTLSGNVARLDEQIKSFDANKGNMNGSLVVSTLDRAQPNPIPVSPKKEKILGLALVAGLALGMSLAMVRDLLDQRLRSLAEIEDTLGTRILGTVPTLGKRVHPLIAGKTVETRPVSDVAEAYRSIRTSLFGVRNHGEARTILVTSATPGEGKTTTVSNLAIAAAQMGRKTLLIDADCRMPSLHLVFKINDGLEKGLSSVLSHDAKPSDVIRPTGIEKLDILTAGPLSSRPAEMLNGNGFTQLLDQMTEEYEHVFIDSPPVVPVADARVLSAITDVTVLVLRAERSTRSQTLRARDALEAIGGRLLGVVVNDAPRRQAQYGCDFDVYPASERADEPVRRKAGRRRALHRAVPALPDTEEVDRPS